MKNNNEKTLLVVADTGWGETLPDWIIREIETERLIDGMCEITDKKQKEWENVGDAEACAYLYTASLKGPLDSDLVNVYMNLAADVMSRRKAGTAEAAKELTEPMTDWQREKLRKLKCDIYRARGGNVKHPILGFLGEMKKQAKKSVNTRKFASQKSYGVGEMAV